MTVKVTVVLKDGKKLPFSVNVSGVSDLDVAKVQVEKRLGLRNVSHLVRA
jgi:hypothetical protein